MQRASGDALCVVTVLGSIRQGPGHRLPALRDASAAP